jgi:transcription-repair coupling factor (superfamily II helicase)
VLGIWNFNTMSQTDHTRISSSQPLALSVSRASGYNRLRTILEGQDSSKRVHVTGLRGSSNILLLEAIRERLGRPLVVVCPDQEAAEDVCSDLGTISSTNALLFPERDIFPQRHEVHENLAVRGDRNEALVRILGGKADIVVTSLLGFLEKTIPVETLKVNRSTVQVGDVLVTELADKNRIESKVKKK